MHQYNTVCDCTECMTTRFEEQISSSLANPDVNFERCSLVASHSTNSTASNLPGPGRTLDKGLGILGRKFESWLVKSAHKIGLDPLVTPHVAVEQCSLVPSHSTNSTASDLPGPGRTLDNFLGRLGRKFENRLAKTAHNVGLGPLAMQTRLAAQITDLDGDAIPSEHERKIMKRCTKLLIYTASTQAISTQYQALRALCVLMSQNIYLRQYFIDCGAYHQLECMHHTIVYHHNNQSDSMMLLSASRLALVWVEDNKIHSVGKELHYLLILSQQDMSTRKLTEADYLLVQLNAIETNDPSPILSDTDQFTETHRALSWSYWNAFADVLNNEASKSDQVEYFLHTIAREIHTLMLSHRHIPSSSALSSLDSYAYPEGDIQTCRKTSEGRWDIYLEIGDLTCVLKACKECWDCKNDCVCHSLKVDFVKNEVYFRTDKEVNWSWWYYIDELSLNLFSIKDEEHGLAHITACNIQENDEDHEWLSIHEGRDEMGVDEDQEGMVGLQDDEISNIMQEAQK